MDSSSRARPKLHPRYRTPTVAILVQAVWAIVLTLSGPYGQLLDYVVFGDWIFFGLTVATLFYYRRRGAPPEGSTVVRLGISGDPDLLHPDRDLRRLELDRVESAERRHRGRAHRGRGSRCSCIWRRARKAAG